MNNISAIDSSYAQVYSVNQVQSQKDNAEEEMSPAEKVQFETEQSLSKTNEALAEEEEKDTVDTASGEGLQSLLEMREETFEASDLAVSAHKDDRSIQQQATDKIEEEREHERLREDTEGLAIGYNSQTAYNLDAITNKEESDESSYEKKALNLDQERTMETYQNMVQKEQDQEEQNKLTMFYM
ncbi:MAG: hypothetical protein LUH14_04570 [Clostridiaceae bacterium]|nr:hypothetical protein [Clostridiaceae bacterium]